MRLKLLGTGGADGVPGLFGDTRVSRYAREHGGKDLRTRAAALVDDGLKLDLGPDTAWQMAREGLTARDWTALVFTHSDDDHFTPSQLQYALFPFTEDEAVTFPIYANATICRRLMEDYPDWPLEMVMTRSFVPFEAVGYRITPIRANHMEGSGEDAQNLLIQDGMSTLLYGTDTGVWHEDTWEFLKGWVLDCLVLECSEGFITTPYNGHLCLRDFQKVLERLRGMGVVHSGTLVTTTHHAHTGDATHAELEAVLNPLGVQVGFDGLQLEF